MPTMQTRNEGVPLTAVQYLEQHKQLSVAIEDQKMMIEGLRTVAEKMVQELQADRVQSSPDGRNTGSNRNVTSDAKVKAMGIGYQTRGGTTDPSGADDASREIYEHLFNQGRGLKSLLPAIKGGEYGNDTDTD